MKPGQKINAEIQWLHYFAIIINKISNLIGKQALSKTNMICFTIKFNGRLTIFIVKHSVEFCDRNMT